jgi:hypothetical protein
MLAQQHSTAFAPAAAMLGLAAAQTAPPAAGQQQPRCFGEGWPLAPPALRMTSAPELHTYSSAGMPGIQVKRSLSASTPARAVVVKPMKKPHKPQKMLQLEGEVRKSRQGLMQYGLMHGATFV